MTKATSTIAQREVSSRPQGYIQSAQCWPTIMIPTITTMPSRATRSMA